VAGEGAFRPPDDTTKRRCATPGTHLGFRLSEDATVLVQIKRAQGPGVVKRFQRGLKAGRHAVRFSGAGLPSRPSPSSP
jgi:hypothetical protein